MWGFQSHDLSHDLIVVPPIRGSGTLRNTANPLRQFLVTTSWMTAVIMNEYFGEVHIPHRGAPLVVMIYINTGGTNHS